MQTNFPVLNGLFFFSFFQKFTHHTHCNVIEFPFEKIFNGCAVLKMLIARGK